MTDIEHSDGPWTYEDEPSSGYREIYNSWGNTIAKVEAWDGDNAPEFMAQAEANARLIAAAPDLLEACRSFLSIVNAACEMNEKILRLSELDAQINLALFAVSKAEGK